MRTLRIVGVAALLGWASSAAGCAADDDDAPNKSGASARGGDAGQGGSGGTESSAGEAGTARGGTTNGDAGDAGDAGDSSAGAGAASVAPYANVIAVVIAGGSEGSYTFGVSVESADIDCTQYANWWEVLTEDGTLSYRRILEHSHTAANGSADADKPGNTFTRTGGPVPVAADTTVLVRAHMSTGGYDGLVMRGSAAAGFTQAPDIGADFATELEGAEPQPTGCAF